MNNCSNTVIHTDAVKSRDINDIKGTAKSNEKNLPELLKTSVCIVLQ